jgi:hypothetical protein
METKKLIEWLEVRVEKCDQLKGMERESWAFKQCLLKVKLEKRQSPQLSNAEEWISVEDRLPEQDERVIVSMRFDNHGWRECVVAHIWEDGEWYNQTGDQIEECVMVTHWMPLPPPPKSEK